MNEDLRQIDAEVAERVMGWRTHKVTENVWYMPNDQNSLHKDEWKPSEDIAFAMQVVEKLYTDHWDVTIYRSVVVEDDWSVEFVRLEEDFKPRNGTAFAKSLPEAICKAALQTAQMGIQGNETRS